MNNKRLKEYEKIQLLISESLEIIMQRIPFENLDTIDVLTLGITKRIVGNYNSAKLLFANNMNLESMIIIRSIIESVFVLNALMIRPSETFKKLFNLSNNNKKLLHKMALSNESLRNNALNYNFESLESSKVKIKDFVDLSPLNKELYEIVYRLMSNKVHINLFSIENFIIFGTDNKFSLAENFDEQEIRSASFALEYCMFLTLQNLNSRYETKIDNKINEIEMYLNNINLN